MIAQLREAFSRGRRPVVPSGPVQDGVDGGARAQSGAESG